MELKTNFLKPVDKWVYCKKDEFVCYENILVGKGIFIRFERPILEISVDECTVVRTENEIALIDEGKIVWRRKLKSSAVSCRGDKVAVGIGKRLIIFDKEGKEILRMKVGKIFALDFDEDLIVVATDKGLKFISKDTWNVDLKANLIKVDFVVAAANYNEFYILTREGDVLWRRELDEIVYDVELNDNIIVYTLEGTVKFDLNGNLIDIVKEKYDFKFVPYPNIYIPKKISELKVLIANLKEMKPKVAKTYLKRAKKLFRAGRYGESYACILKAFENLKDVQLSLKIPKKVFLNKEFTIEVSYKNVLYENVEGLKVDLTDFEKYFEIEPKVVEFPQMKRGMFVKFEVRAVPKYIGIFKVEVNARSNVDEIRREMEIRVVKKRIGVSFRRRERSLLELIE